MTTVAIVEDNNIMRKTLTELVDGAAGYRCVCACSTSKEAQVQIPKHGPDVVLMDIHLPDESGIECTARLTEKMPDLQVIMVTVYKDIDLIFRALKAGACGYILKRFRANEILQAIAEARAGGAPMTSEIARMVVRSFRSAPSGASESDGLSTRETEILALLAEGLSNKEIADSDVINAMALPGGFFYVNSGLILNADEEAELAGVMAHETAHVCAHHAVREMTRMNYAQIGMMPVMILVGGWTGYGIYEAAQLAIPITFLQVLPRVRGAGRLPGRAVHVPRRLRSAGLHQLL